MKNVAYLRVSTADQDLDKFKADILLFANTRRFGNVTFTEEKISGKKDGSKKSSTVWARATDSSHPN